MGACSVEICRNAPDRSLGRRVEDAGVAVNACFQHRDTYKPRIDADADFSKWSPPMRWQMPLPFWCRPAPALTCGTL